jgi:uncharacterized protein (TIGR03083 family)
MPRNRQRHDNALAVCTATGRRTPPASLAYAKQAPVPVRWREILSSNPRTWIATLRQSHDRLDKLVTSLSPEQVRVQSYDTEWTIAQVLSHLGSGAEIALMTLPAALGEAPPVGNEAFPAVWEKWNAKGPDEQAADGLASDEKHVQTLEALTDEQLASIDMDFFGMMRLDAVGVVRLRLSEHAMHTWDVEVVGDPAATVQPPAVDLLIDNVAQFLAPRLGKPLSEPFSVRITTADPARDYLLTSGESVTVTDWPGEAGADDDVPHVTMPAEALLRLAYGRLDPDHTPPAVAGDTDTLTKLRVMFPGF